MLAHRLSWDLHTVQRLDRTATGQELVDDRRKGPPQPRDPGSARRPAHRSATTGAEAAAQVFQASQASGPPCAPLIPCPSIDDMSDDGYDLVGKTAYVREKRDRWLAEV